MSKENLEFEICEFAGRCAKSNYGDYVGCRGEAKKDCADYERYKLENSGMGFIQTRHHTFLYDKRFTSEEDIRKMLREME